MAGKDLRIGVLVTSNAGPKFKEIGESGKRAGTEVASGAKTASDSLVKFGTAVDAATANAKRFSTTTEAALGRVDKSAAEFKAELDALAAELKGTSSAFADFNKRTQETDRSLDTVTASTKDYGNAGRELGLGLAALGSSFTLFARSAVDQERSIQAIGRLYGEASDGALDYADALARQTVFSDDAARSALLMTGSLTEAYGLSASQAQNLVGVSADLATVFGTDLATAVEAVASGTRGEAESLERFGVSLSDSAVAAYAAANGLGEWSKMTDEAAKSQIRYQYLLEQTAKYQGTAAEFADTTAGKVQNLTNRITDYGQGLAAATGPAGQVVAGLSNIGLESGLAIAGVASLAKGLRDLNAASQNAGKLSTAISLLKNPYVIVGAVAAGFTYKAVQGLLEHGTAVKDLEAAYLELGGVIENLPDAGASAAQTAAIEAVKVQLEALIPMYNEWSNKIGEVGSATIMGPHWSEITIDAQTYFTTIADGVLTFEQEAQAVDLVTQAVTTQGANLDAVTGRVEELVAAHQLWITSNGQLGIDGDMLVELLGQLATNAATYGDSATETAAAVVSLADAFQVLDSVIGGAISAGIADQFIDGLEKMAPVLEHVINEIITSTTTGLTTTGLDAGDWWGLTGGPEAALKLQADMEAIGEAAGLGGEKARRAMYALAEAYYAGLISADQYAAGVAEAAGNVDALNEHYLRLGRTIKGEVTPSANELNTILFGQAGTMRVAAKATAEHELVMSKLDVKQDQAGRTMDRTTASAREQTNVVGLHVLEVERDTVALTRAIDMQAVFGRHIEANDAILLAGIERLKEYREAGAQALEGLGVNSLASKLDFAGYQTPSISLAVDTGNAVTALSDVYRAVVTNTHAIGNQTQVIADWVGEFVISTEDQISTLDQLYADHQISGKTFRDGIKATTSILGDNADVQEDLGRIQAKQLPLLARLADEQAKYIDLLADGDAETAMVALGYMDAAESAKAFSAVQLVANAALGGFEGVASDAVIAAAQADPVLKAMLEDMGLISVGADGTITVNFDDADGLNQAVADVADSIDALTRAILGIPDPVTSHIDLLIAGESNGSDHAQGVVQDLIDRINDADGTDAEPTITLNDLASDGLDAIKYLLDNLDGRDVNTTVTTTYQRVGVGFTEAATGTTMNHYATGGSMYDQYHVDIPHYATGGGHAIVGEVGPELVWLPNGSQVTNAAATRSRLETEERRGRGRGDIINRGTIIIQPASSDIEPAIRRKLLSSSRR